MKEKFRFFNLGESIIINDPQGFFDIGTGTNQWVVANIHANGKPTRSINLGKTASGYEIRDTHSMMFVVETQPLGSGYPKGSSAF